MSISMYQASIPVLIRGLENLSHLLEQAVSHVEAHQIDPVVLLEARLYQDMYPLTRQVQISSDTAKGAGARLAGVENPSFADTETSFPELQERIEKTITFLRSITPEQIDGSEDRPIVLKTRVREINFTGQNYLLQHVLPNFFFHVTTTYGLLRHHGVSVGKVDYLGSF